MLYRLRVLRLKNRPKVFAQFVIRKISQIIFVFLQTSREDSQLQSSNRDRYFGHKRYTCSSNLHRFAFIDLIAFIVLIENSGLKLKLKILLIVIEVDNDSRTAPTGAVLGILCQSHRIWRISCTSESVKIYTNLHLQKLQSF